MNVLKEFDSFLAQEEIQTYNIHGGYLAAGNPNPYDTYLDNNSWNALKATMMPSHRMQYDCGGGKELEESNGRPPKMAAFASSSRMIYMHSKHNAEFIFEKKLTTTVGGIANLDGYLSLPDKDIYVEAKCREPYAHKAEQIIKQNYRGIYDYLCKSMPNTFSCNMEDIPEVDGNPPKRNMRVSFFCNGKPVAYFDIKQMICHLLAVATEGLNHPNEKDILFLYFLYSPTHLPLTEAKAEIHRIYNETCWAATHYDMESMFGHVVNYLRGIKDFPANDAQAARLKKNFRFILCDQSDYSIYLK